MKDFIEISIHLSVEQNSIIEILRRKLANFNWRSGDSDSQGKYLYGTNEEHINVQFWMDENPAIISISFRGANLDKTRQEEMIKFFASKFSSLIGNIIDIDT